MTWKTKYLFCLPILLFFICLHKEGKGQNRDILYQKADSLNTLGIQQGRKGHLDSAATNFIKGAQLLATDTIYFKLRGDIHNNLGLVNKLQGKYKDALKQYLIAASTYHTSSHNLAGTYSNIGNLYEIHGEYSRAEEYHLKAYFILKNLNSKKSLNTLISVTNNLGILYKNTEKPSLAIKYFEESITLHKRNKKNPANGIFINLANAYATQGNYHEAINIFNSILPSSGTNSVIKIKQYAKTLQNYALILREQKDYTQSLRLLEKALELTTNKEANTFFISKIQLNIGLIHHTLGHYNSALSYFQKALYTLSNEKISNDYNKNPDAKKIKGKKYLLKVLKEKSQTLKAIGFQTDSLDYLKAALDIHHLRTDIIKELRTGYQDQQSKLLLLASEKSTFDEAIFLSQELYHRTADTSYLNSAFYFSEASKAAILYENLQTNKAMHFAGIPKNLMKREHALKKDIWMYQELIYEEGKREYPNKNRLEYWHSELFTAKQQYETLIDTFENIYPDYYKLKYDQQILSLSEVKNQLSDREVILEYYLQDSVLYSFLVSKKEAHIHKTAIDSSFVEKIESIDKLLKKNNFSNNIRQDYDDLTQNLHSLYTKLIAPFAKQLDKKDILVIIPDGELAYLPFEVLLTTSDINREKVDYKKLPYLLRNHPVQYSYSATLHIENSTLPKRASKKLAAFAPTYGSGASVPQKNQLATRQQYREKLFPILGIIEEASTVSRLMDGDTFLKDQATEHTFKQQAEDYDILHLAMHTLIDDKNPLYSKMAFTQLPDSSEDGFLNTFEIFNLKLSTRMAVLSSCNTGRGKLLHGEGVMSLARGFMYAGCPSIVMTLWAVEDKSGVSLMTYFYKNLRSGMSKPEALQQAKLSFLENADKLHSHPYFWSGYVSIGDIHPLYKKWNLYIWGSASALVLISLMGFWVRKRKKSRKLF